MGNTNTVAIDDDCSFTPIENELHPEFLGIAAQNPQAMHDSSSRQQMLGSHASQAQRIRGATKRRLVTMMEREFGKYTFKIVMPVKGLITKIIPRYQESHGFGGVKENPQTIIIYENVETKEIGHIDLQSHHLIHEHFGFKYVINPFVNLTVGAIIEAGTVIADSPAVTPDGDYMTGIELEVALMTDAAINEDGVVINEDIIPLLTFDVYAFRQGKITRGMIPLNLYGNDEEYKICPDIGEYVNADGLLFCLREFDDMLAPVTMTREALRQPDYIYDKPMYVEPNAKVIDIKILVDGVNKPILPYGMEKQLRKYIQMTNEFSGSLVSEYRRLYSKRRKEFGKLELEEKTERFIVNAIGDDPVKNRLKPHGDQPPKPKAIKTHRQTPIDGFRIEIVLEYPLVPNTGTKLTGLHGNKGVICDIRPGSFMPRDTNGNVADLIMCPDSPIKRMNIGVPNEQYINAATRDVSERLREMFGLPRKNPVKEQIKTALYSGRAALIDQAHKYLLAYYKTVSPKMYDAAIAVKIDPKERLYNAMMDTTRNITSQIWYPTNTNKATPDVILDIARKFPPCLGPVTYKNSLGMEFVTRNDILIGSMYIWVLDKPGDEWAGVSSARVQHHGIVAKLTNEDKYSTPGRGQPTRIMGEYETHHFSAIMGSKTTADLIDQSNNPLVHRVICRNILTADKPTAIQSVIDREQYPLGHARPLEFVRHILDCSGIEFERNDNPGA